MSAYNSYSTYVQYKGVNNILCQNQKDIQDLQTQIISINVDGKYDNTGGPIIGDVQISGTTNLNSHVTISGGMFIPHWKTIQTSTPVTVTLNSYEHNVFVDNSGAEVTIETPVDVSNGLLFKFVRVNNVDDVSINCNAGYSIRDISNQVDVSGISMNAPPFSTYPLSAISFVHFNNKFYPESFI